MAWIKQKKNEHVCQKPDLRKIIDVYPGDIWECDDCGLQWMVYEHQLDGLYWMERK